MSRPVRRVGNWVYVGEGDHRYSFADPSRDTAGGCASAYHYLLVTCPSTTEAVEKLRDMRRALAALSASGGADTTIGDRP